VDATTTPVPVKRAAPALARPAMNMFGALQREIDRLFDDFARGGFPSLATAGPAVRMDLADTKEGIELTAELPGLQEKDVQVTLSDNLLTVSGEKQAEKEEKEKNYHFVERSYGAFSRSIELPADVQADRITATISNGVLKVTIPRAAKAEPKKIEVKAAA
jgi:HSP20 family protein